MRTVGIICECNPFHAGHRHLIEAAKEDGDCCVIALMSGGFVQRGTTAILDTYSRTELLLDGGADVVLELPFPFSAAGAEYFASAGVRILSSLGIGELWFGSESGDLHLLTELADLATSDAFVEEYRSLCKSGEGTAAAFRKAMTICGFTGEIAANDLLAIAYLQSLKKQKSMMVPHTVKRVGMPYASTELQVGNYPSASALRKAWLENGAESIKPYFSTRGYEILRNAIENKLAPTTQNAIWNLAFSRFRIEPETQWDSFAEMGGGLGRRLAKVAKNVDSSQSFQQAISSKYYPDARIQRAILFALTGITKKDLKGEITYVNLLGANAPGRAFLAGKRKAGGIAVITSHSKIPKVESAKIQRGWEERSHALFTLCLPVVPESGFFLRKQPILTQAGAVASEKCKATKKS